MKTLSLILMCCFVVLAFTAASAQEIDLSVANISIDVQGGGMYVNPTIGLKAFGDVPAINSTIDIYFDGLWAESFAWQIVPFQSGSCPLNVYPDCSGNCNDLVFGGVIYYGSCYDEYIAAQTLWRCACRWYTYGEGQILHPITDQTTVTVKIDLAGTVPEWDETNNEMTMDIMAVADDSPTWSSLKAMFR